MLRKIMLLAACCAASGTLGVHAQGADGAGQGGAVVKGTAGAIAQAGAHDGASCKLCHASPVSFEPDFWIGLQVGELNPVVKEQLSLEGGIAVEKVLPESPAAKAGVKARDILLRSGEKPMMSPVDLHQVVGAAKTSEFKLTLLRGGKEQEIVVTPEKRPLNLSTLESHHQHLPKEARSALEQVMKQMKEAQAKVGGEGLELDFNLVGPGVLVQKQITKMPEDLHISIQKEGNNPAKITVKQQEQTWEVTEDKLDELPEEIRTHVKGMLGKHHGLAFDFKLNEDGKGGGKLPKFRDKAASEFDPAVKHMEEQLKKMQEQLEAIKQRQAIPGKPSLPKTSTSTPRSQPQQPEKNGSGASAFAAGFSAASATSNGNGSQTQSVQQSEVRVGK